ncbi:uroporphyrinogen-III synthase [Aquimarina pacifica]|uniref:uroporphyrinogen-III synthase n=1 Tax=Aquimarina pacifica TaxID=1296415 RepID=UPI000471498F|nr:uroporphyrinogen-III synthase [Aquimarina pacifica]
MKKQNTLLSTKKLTSSQKELLLNAGLGYVAYDAILIEQYTIETAIEVENAIFTSKNAVRVIQNAKAKIQNCFCVGSNTKNLLEENGYTVVETAQNALDLAKIIVKKYKNHSFSFFCGNLRRDELPDYLNRNDIKFNEQIVYKTSLEYRSFDRFFDGILFFSPSAVVSYTLENKIKDSVAFCIGKTTAAEVQRHTEAEIIIANKPTVENVIVQAAKYFENK